VTHVAELVRTMVQLADNLVDDFDIVDLLSTLTVRCVEVLDIAAAGIMLVGVDGHLRPMSSSDETMSVVELFEIQSQEGPCFDCFRTGLAIVDQDLTAAHDRWPQFAPVAVEAGYRAVDAVPMRLRGKVIGALNLFRVDTGSLNDDDVVVAQALADIATIAILQSRSSTEAQQLNEQLSTALSSRIVIEQAKGILAERLHVSIGEAFDRMRRYARNRNRRLADVAHDTVNGDIVLDDFAGGQRPRPR
jgi:GAF domain-containing protein